MGVNSLRELELESSARKSGLSIALRSRRRIAAQAQAAAAEDPAVMMSQGESWSFITN